MIYKDTELVTDKSGMRTEFLNSTASLYPIMGFAEGKSLEEKQETELGLVDAGMDRRNNWMLAQVVGSVALGLQVSFYSSQIKLLNI